MDRMTDLHPAGVTVEASVHVEDATRTAAYAMGRCMYVSRRRTASSAALGKKGDVTTPVRPTFGPCIRRQRCTPHEQWHCSPSANAMQTADRARK